MVFNQSLTGVCWKPIQTAWNQIRPDRQSGLIWIQTYWHSDNWVPERISLKKINLDKISKQQKACKNTKHEELIKTFSIKSLLAPLDFTTSLGNDTLQFITRRPISHILLTWFLRTSCIVERSKVNLAFHSLCGSIGEELGKAFPKTYMAAILVMWSGPWMQTLCPHIL